MDNIVFGDCRDIMRQWAKDGVKAQTCVTSPPYYGLRDYGTGTWIGGDETCSHKRDSKYSENTITGHSNKALVVGDAIYKDVCPKCGAVRKDLQVGLEQTPEDYVKAIVEVFDCVWDVLEDDGTLWLNLGDSYYNYRPGKGQAMNKQTVSKTNQDLPTTNARRGNKLAGLKEKDLIGIPWRVAFALQDAGWYLRQDIIWHKPNPMPESVKDRCTKAHEYIFLFSKKPQYFFDSEGIKEDALTAPAKRNKAKEGYQADYAKGARFSDGERTYGADGKRNKRDVWSVPVRAYKGAHFATFPPPLIEPCILAGSRVNDIVLDPFMGSGTTAMVAKQHGRRYIGCELNEDYRELQDTRLGIDFKKDLFNNAIT